MIKRLLILALVVFAVYVFYKKFVAPVVIPGIQENKGNVDFFGKKHEIAVDKSSPGSP